MATLDIEQIKAFLPHRYPFLLVDKVVDYSLNEFLVAIKNVTFDEPCFQGHFPQKSVFPGVLIIEAMAQAAALLGCISLEKKSEHSSSLYYLVGIDKARFKQTVAPGDQLRLEARFIKLRGRIFFFSTTATVDDTFIASANVMTTIVDE